MAEGRGSLAASVWGLEFDSEHVFLGDQVAPAQSRPSRRTGLDVSINARLADVVHVNVDASYAQARFTNADPSGRFIPGAVEGVVSAGVGYAPSRDGFAGVSLRCFGPRPLIQDDSVRSPASTLVDADAGFRSPGHWRVEVQVSNLFDREMIDAEYFYVSRLPGEPATGVADRHRHPQGPRSFRLA